MTYLRRAVDQELDELLPYVSAIAIDGAKGVGKTSTALQRADASWFLDDSSYREVAEADFTFSTVSGGTLLIDEWQQVPAVWDAVRRQVDANMAGAGGGPAATGGADTKKFILTGSASPRSAAGTHSGAGRILSVRMRPMALFERGEVQPTVSLRALLEGGQPQIAGATEYELADYVEAIVASGFPGILPLPSRARRAQLDAYIQRVIDRDLPDLGAQVRRPEVLRRWLAGYAAASSTPTAYSRLLDATTGGDGTQPAQTTTIAYREHLTRLWLLDPVPGWLPANNAIKKLAQAPKHQLVDPAVAARLLGITEGTLLSPKTAYMAGPLFESLVTLSVRAAAQAAEARVSHLRLAGGAREIDLIVEGMDGQVLGIEVKLARSVSDHDVRHLHWLREQMPDRVADLMVVNTGPVAYRRPDGVAVVPLALLGM